jgi:hypothetical protein
MRDEAHLRISRHFPQFGDQLAYRHGHHQSPWGSVLVGEVESFPITISS